MYRNNKHTKRDSRSVAESEVNHENDDIIYIYFFNSGKTFPVQQFFLEDAIEFSG